MPNRIFLIINFVFKGDKMVNFNKKRICNVHKSNGKVAVDVQLSDGRITTKTVDGATVSVGSILAAADDWAVLFDGMIIKRIKGNLIIEKGE